MPTCAGGPLERNRCRIRPAAFIVGSGAVEGVPGLCYAAACPIHLEDVRSFLSVPWGALEVEYTAQGWKTIERELEQGGGGFELRKREAG